MLPPTLSQPNDVVLIILCLCVQVEVKDDVARKDCSVGDGVEKYCSVRAVSVDPWDRKPASGMLAPLVASCRPIIVVSSTVRHSLSCPGSTWFGRREHEVGGGGGGGEAGRTT